MIIPTKRIMAIARAERRTISRLLRYWIFLSLAYLVTFIPYARQSYIHGVFSSYSGILGALAPCFLMSQIGLYYSVTFLIGTIFLAFDVRERDKRERVVEVLDSRPYSNLELVIGRFLGIFLSSWIPIVTLAIIFEVAGLILMGLGSPVGEPIGFFSLLSFVFRMIVPGDGTRKRYISPDSRKRPCFPAFIQMLLSKLRLSRRRFYRPRAPRTGGGCAAASRIPGIFRG